MTEVSRSEDVIQSTLGDAWNLFTADFVLWIIAGLILLVVSIFSLGILSGPMTVGFIKLVEKRRQGEPGSVGDIFDGFSHFGASLIASILIGIGVFIGGLLFILPGVLFGFAMCFTFQAIGLQREDAIAAMGTSFRVIKENLAMSAVFVIIVLVVNSVGAMVFVGTLLTMPFTIIVMTLAYQRLVASSPEV